MKFDITAYRSGHAALEKNLTDLVQEAMLKIGFADMPMRFYYPVDSLERLMGMEWKEPGAEDAALFRSARSARMAAVLEDFAETRNDLLGRIGVSREGGRFCLTIPAEGVRRVRDTVPEPAFLAALIRAVEAHPRDEEALTEVFEAYASSPESVVCRRVGGEFDLLYYFEDGIPDDYRYCVKFEGGDEHGQHVIYHRFTPGDYEALDLEER